MKQAERYALGIDLGGTHVAAGVVEHGGRILARSERPTEARRGLQAVIGNIVAVAQAAVKQVPVRVEGVGVGAPGTLDVEAGVVRLAPNLGWREVPLKAALEERLGQPTWIDNDANCAALGEQWCGAAKGARHVVMLTLGTGVGGGLVLDGKVFRGASGYAGEVGHMPVLEDGPPCGCGRNGCLEALAAAPAIAGRGRQAAEAGRSPGLLELCKGDTTRISARMVFQAALRADEAAQRVIADTARYLGIATAALVNVLNPAMVVIGGGVSAAGEQLLAPLRQEVLQRAMQGPAQAAQIVQAALGNEAGIIGAASLVWR